MHRFVFVCVLTVGLVACSLQDAFRGDVGIVARGGPLQLERDSLAAVLASGPNVPLRRDIAEQWAYRWVEFALFVERVAQGDSMLDSVTVHQAMWPDANQLLVDRYHDKLAAERVRLDSAVIDSAYAAGDARLIDHILIRTRPDMSPPERAAALRRAEALRARLMAGESWEIANRENDDPAAKQAGGSLGVIERNQMVPPFEEAAFALQPGEMSAVVETQYGYHVIRRPPLRDVRDRYAESVGDVLTVRMDSVFLEELAERWRIDVRGSAPATMREAAAAPLRTFKSGKVLATYRGGRFTSTDFVRWLQALPVLVHQNVSGADDEQLTELATSLVRNEVLVREARGEGTSLTEEEWFDLRERLRGQIEQVKTRIGLDSAFAGATTLEARRRAGADAVTAYFYRLAATLRGVVVVPAFLAAELRAEMSWDVSQPGVDQALELATRWRQEAEQAASPEPQVAPADSGAPQGEKR